MTRPSNQFNKQVEPNTILLTHFDGPKMTRYTKKIFGPQNPDYSQPQPGTSWGGQNILWKMQKQSEIQSENSWAFGCFGLFDYLLILSSKLGLLDKLELGGCPAS